MLAAACAWLALSSAAALSVDRPPPNIVCRRAAVRLCGTEISLPREDPEEGPGEELLSPEVECSSGRIVTELRQADKTQLPDRFLMAVRAIRGEFSTVEGEADNERVEDSLTSALLTFPATVSLRVVTRKLASSEEGDLLRDELNALLSTLEGAEAPEARVTERGSRRSFDFQLSVPDASSLSMLRAAIKEDERVQMVF